MNKCSNNSIESCQKIQFLKLETCKIKMNFELDLL